MSGKYPLLQVVDENDVPIGEASRDEILEKNLFHRISRVMLSNSEGKILLQKRSKHVYFPERWDHSAAGHVDGGEDYLTAAKREMVEEIGVSDINLEELAYYKNEEIVQEGLTMRRFNKLYKGQIDFTPTNIDPSEVSEVRWFSLDEIRDMIKNNPEEITVGLKYVIERYYN